MRITLQMNIIKTLHMNIIMTPLITAAKKNYKTNHVNQTGWETINPSVSNPITSTPPSIKTNHATCFAT